MYDATIANRYETPVEYARRRKLTLAILKACDADRCMRNGMSKRDAMQKVGYTRVDIMMTAIKKFRPEYQKAPAPLER